MFENPRNVCVIGAGTMGSGIAAHLANLGFEVTLLDLTGQSVRAAFDKAKTARPPHFYLSSTADSIRLGSIEENLDWVREADWVCEAIVEKTEAKKSLFSRIEPLLKPGAIITTNTSGLQISLLADDRGEAFRRVFMGTHFFNPPRYLKLLELIPTRDTSPQAIEAMTRFLEEKCARRVVLAKDTPGFIANRFGMWSMIYAIHVTERLGLSIEEVDAITGPFIGRPNSASFRLNDLVGLDIMQDIADNLVRRCPYDPCIKHLATPKSMAALLEKGWIGEKTGQGYFRRSGHEIFAFDLTTHAYRMRQDVSFDSIKELGKLPLKERLPKALELRDQVGDFLREYLLPTLRYADQLKEEVSHNVEDFDRVMKWGFGWEAGPFETIDMIGAERVGIGTMPYYQGQTMLTADGTYVARKDEPQYAALTEFPVVSEHDGFRVRDLGDSVHAVCATTKMGVYSPSMIRAMSAYLQSGKSKRIVLTSEAKVFSAGFDLKFLLDRIGEEDWDACDKALKDFQDLGLLLRTIPSCSAVFGVCLGGGFEMAASCSHLAANAETQIGLPESRVGLLPSGGGCPIMHTRHQENAKSLCEAAKLLTLGTIARNAEEARKCGFIRAEDPTIYHPDRLLAEAKRIALTAEPAGVPAWAMVTGPVLGMIERTQDELTKKGEITQHDCAIGDRIKHAIAKAESFEDSLAKERASFIELLKDGLTQNRIRHMVETGKPLRN
jgi:3-hydroxyacyl-CoA dehydrogenase